MFPFEMRRATLRAPLHDCPEKREREPEDKEKRCDDIRQDTNIGIFYWSEEIDREEKNKREQRRRR